MLYDLRTIRFRVQKFTFNNSSSLVIALLHVAYTYANGGWFPEFHDQTAFQVWTSNFFCDLMFLERCHNLNNNFSKYLTLKSLNHSKLYDKNILINLSIEFQHGTFGVQNGSTNLWKQFDHWTFEDATNFTNLWT